MKKIKNVSNQELKDSLLKSIEYNSNALDYIENVLNRARDRLKYNEYDKENKEIVETLEYIKFALTYLDKQYIDSLKKVGVKSGFNR